MPHSVGCLERIVVRLDAGAVGGGAVLAPQHHHVGPALGLVHRGQRVWLYRAAAADQRPPLPRHLAQQRFDVWLGVAAHRD
jgi:hypothetical protein